MNQQANRLLRRPCGPGCTRTASETAPAVTGPVATYFQQPCPTCGRRLLIPVKHLGKEVFCGHCRRAFVARDGLQVRDADEPADHSILQRADRLLARLDSLARDRRLCGV
jgi:hypothetical protein